jgi:hypothetical protein
MPEEKKINTSPSTKASSDKVEYVKPTEQKSSNAWIWWVVGCCGCLIVVVIIAAIILAVTGYFTFSKVSNELNNLDTGSYDYNYDYTYPDDSTTDYNYDTEDWEKEFGDMFSEDFFNSLEQPDTSTDSTTPNSLT